MDKYYITLTQRAKDDIIDIGDYITFQLSEPDISKNFIKGLRTVKETGKIFLHKSLSVSLRYLPPE